MSRAIHFTFTVLAWLSLPFWGLAVTAALVWDVRSVVIAFALALTATCAWPYRHLTERVEGMVKQLTERNDGMVKQIADMVHDRETALIRAIDLLASGPPPAAAAEPETTEANKLRAA